MALFAQNKDRIPFAVRETRIVSSYTTVVWFPRQKARFGGQPFVENYLLLLAFLVSSFEFEREQQCLGNETSGANTGCGEIIDPFI